MVEILINQLTRWEHRNFHNIFFHRRGGNNMANVYWHGECKFRRSHVNLTDTAKLTGPRTLADKWWVGPVKLLCIIMFDISKIRPKSFPGPVKAQKFSRCLTSSCDWLAWLVSSDEEEQSVCSGVMKQSMFLLQQSCMPFLSSNIGAGFHLVWPLWHQGVETFNKVFAFVWTIFAGDTSRQMRLQCFKISGGVVFHHYRGTQTDVTRSRMNSLTNQV